MQEEQLLVADQGDGFAAQVQVAGPQAVGMFGQQGVLPGVDETVGVQRPRLAIC